MMPMLLDWFSDLFTLAGLAHFLFGAGTAFVYHWIKAQIKHRKIVFKSQYFVVPLVIGIIAYTAITNQQNADCVRQFQHALKARSQITIENDEISIQQRQLIYNWIHALVFPPPEIAQFEPNSPERNRWELELTIETDKKFSESMKKQKENDEQRRLTPYPEPTCGLR